MRLPGRLRRLGYRDGGVRRGVEPRFVAPLYSPLLDVEAVELYRAAGVKTLRVECTDGSVYEIPMKTFLEHAARIVVRNSSRRFVGCDVRHWRIARPAVENIEQEMLAL